MASVTGRKIPDEKEIEFSSAPDFCSAPTERTRTKNAPYGVWAFSSGVRRGGPDGKEKVDVFRPVVDRGQRYVCLDWRPHVRHDGAVTVLFSWGSNCAHCGREFSFLAPGGRFPEYPNRRCTEHAAKGRRA